MSHISCLIRQWLISFRLEDGRPPSTATRRHLDGCPACRRFLDEQARLVGRMELDASAEIVPPPPFLKSGVMNAAWRSSTPSRRRAGWLLPITATVTLAAILLSMTWVSNRSGGNARSAPRQASVEPIPRLLTSLWPAGILPDDQKLREWSQSLDRPLESEIASVVKDAQTAWQSVAQNFLFADTSSSPP